MEHQMPPKTLTLKDIIADVAAQAGVTQKQAGDTVASLISVIREELADGNELQLSGLGKFSTDKRAARKGRNPSTGEEIDIPAKRVVKFSPAKALKDAVAE
jgi:DNA-binding protein HU-beta